MTFKKLNSSVLTLLLVWQNESTVDRMMIPELTYTLLAPASLSSRRTHTGAHEKLITSHFGKFTHSPSTEGPIVL